MTDLVLNSREAIQKFEAILLSMPQAEITTNHYFCNGMYAREIHIPKGCTLTGYIHKSENLNIISKGKVSIFTEDFKDVVEAPRVIVSLPGTKRVGYAHEDSTWVTILRTDETDIDKIEKLYLTNNFEDLKGLIE